MLTELSAFLSVLYYFSMNKLEEKYLPTKEVKSTLKVSDCDVMHLRETVKLAFSKKEMLFGICARM